ncbi:ABC transporter ATP-binding protein [Shewanella sp. WXL01]|uniref:ABC transporter ATP-binding protein n=1 Tax=Shewanella maritima TaxID=2520507 RepID=A0A411PHU0_9GAMM|nr:MULTISPECIES: ABC transporter ATP-binding protein [Shewanella]NKF52523.1 ABC transporter ATP-binding protein [Shewanella sp. WXL01]QBF82930.1 ABC transporter ATP-binding protein [Shewanella maritima]
MSVVAADLHCELKQQSPIPIDASFSCKAGEVLAVVGPSGGGKTTLLRMIAGLSHAEQGFIRYGEQDWFNANTSTQLSPQQRHIGYMPQHFGLFPHLSAVQNVMAGLEHIAKPERLPRAQDWLERVNLHGMPDRLPANLSGGQRQRVALARALAREPKVLLLDEPFSAVDRETRERLYIELAKLKSQLAIPVIMVTHDINEALLLADKMLLISQGKMQQQGKPFEVLSHPQNEAVARQMGLRNIFSSTVAEVDKQQNLTRFKLGDHVIACDGVTDFEPDQAIRWVIPNQGIRFNSISRGRLCRSINKLEVTIESLLVMGESVRIIASIDGVNERINTDVPSHLADKLQLRVGLQTTVALKSDQIHIFS